MCANVPLCHQDTRRYAVVHPLVKTYGKDPGICFHMITFVECIHPYYDIFLKILNVAY